METLDWIVVAAYFAILVVVVWLASRKVDTTADYFLAGRNAGFFVIGASLFASNIGSEHVVGLAGQGATTGMAMAHYELHAWIMVLLAWVFVPFYYRSGVYTVPEFVEKRFGPSVRWVLAIVSLIAYIFTKVAVTVYAGATVFQVLLPTTFGSPQAAFWVGAFATVIITGIYTIFGGMRAVLWTDAAQTIILLLGAIFITTIGLNRLGGWDVLQSTLSENADQFALWRPIDDPVFPWPAVLIASPIVGIWYWCTDQYIVQRTLTARNLTQSRRGALFGGALKVMPVFLFMVPGMIGYALNEQGLLDLTPGEGGTIANDAVFPALVAELLPVGLRGLVVAGLLAALMSSLSSLFNSTASLFTIDIYDQLRPGRSDQHLVNVGRIATGIVVAAGIAWIPVMERIAGGGLYQYLQSVQGYLAPPITAVFLLGLFNRRINAAGALWGLILGFLIGMSKLTLETFFSGNPERGLRQSPEWLAALADFNFLYFSGIQFLICIAIIVAVSLMTAAPPLAKTQNLTYFGRTEEDKRELRESRGPVDIVLTALVLGLVLGIYLYFSFWLA